MVAVEAVPVATASVAVRVAVADGNDVSAIVMPHRISALCTLILDCARYAAMEKLQVVCDLLLHGLISYRSTVEFQDSAVLFLLLSHRFISPQARYFNHTLHPKLVKKRNHRFRLLQAVAVFCVSSLLNIEGLQQLLAPQGKVSRGCKMSFGLLLLCSERGWAFRV